jgi:WD40 repeat protein
LWNIKEQACIYSFNPLRGLIQSMFFAEGTDSACIAVSQTGSIIRLWRSEGSITDFASETVGEVDQDGAFPLGAVFSPSGSSLATSFRSRTGDASILAWYEIETMTKTQSVVMPGFSATCVAVSPDSKQFVYGDYNGRIRLLQTDDLRIQRVLDTTGVVSSLAFDPTCGFLAFGCQDGRLIELRTLSAGHSEF